MFPSPSVEQSSAPEISLTQISDLKAQVRQVLSGPTILGSQLGSLIIRAAASLGTTISLRKYGGLRKFAETHLRDLVALKLTHGPGQAEIYDVLIEPSNAAASSDSRAPMVLNQKSHRFFWAAISNPFSKFSIEKKDGTLVCSVRGDSQTSQEEVLPPFTIQEYQKIVASFAATLNEPERDSALKILESTPPSSLHKTWTNFLYTQCLPEVSAAWQRFRVSKLIDLFKQKAIEIGIKPEQVDAYVLQLRQAEPAIPQKTARHAASNIPQADPRKAKAVSHITSGDISLTALQLAVVDIITKMTDDQLRQLSLPLGLSLDATMHFHRK